MGRFVSYPRFLRLEHAGNLLEVLTPGLPVGGPPHPFDLSLYWLYVS